MVGWWKEEQYNRNLVEVELFEIMPKFKALQDKGELTFLDSNDK